jgi:hydrogenase expression/formation protein HypC
MCLAVPMRIISMTESTGIAEMGGVKKNISFIMCPEAKIDDYVIVHAGFAIQILDENEANERLKLFRQIVDLDEPSN